MKKVIMTAALVAAAVIGLQARQLSASEALERAAVSLRDNSSGVMHAPRMESMRLIGSGSFQSATTAGEDGAAWYLFGNGTETMVVSGNDIAAPVLGYMDTPLSSMDQLAPPARYWLEEYAREIAWAAGRPGLSKAYDTRGTAARAQRVAIAPMLETQWNQDAPYNNNCPSTYAGQRTYTGCVATAMAQVMRYHRYPSTATGRVSYKWNNGTRNVSLSLDLSEVSFDWSDMADSYGTENPGTTAQQQAVATLMQACGYSVSMNYGAGSRGSGTQSYRIRQAMATNFGYDKGMNMQSRDYFMAEEWDEMMYENLRTVGPCIYNGQGSSGGHSFVCDGYRPDGFYHINWGWGGRSDGYYLLSALDPTNTGIGGGSGGYNYQQDAVLGIRPPVAGSVEALPYMAIYGDMKVTTSRRQLTLTADGSQGGFYNMSGIPGTFNVAVRLTGDDSAPVYITLYTGSEWASHVGFTKKTFDLPAALPDGTYTLVPVYQVNQSTVWTPMLYNKENSYGSLEITVSGNSVTVQQPVSTDPEHVRASLAQGLEFKTGQTATVDATLFNDNSTERRIVTFLALCNDNINVVQNSDNVNVYIGANTSATAQYTLSIPDDLDEGIYRLLVCAYFGDNAYAINPSACYVTVKSGAGAEDITADSPALPVTYYTLSGIALPGAPTAPGVYLRRQGTRTTKLLVK